MEKLKKHWQIESNFQLLVIIFVFSLNGSLSVVLAKPLMKLMGISIENLGVSAFWILRIIIMFILYQILLVLIGWLFGQYKFFWRMERKILSRFTFVFKKLRSIS
jgi:hypothetical protein